MSRSDPPPEGAYPPVEGRPTVSKLRAAARRCRACDLWKTGTQTVFGEGAARAALMLVGEQPGDREDRAGHPFVGPAGGILEAALQEAGIDRREIWLTNAVKHFKWEPRGKRRIHAKPNAREVAACMRWLQGEIALVRPRVIVCLGAAAAQALLGRSFRVTRDRGKVVPSPYAARVLATIHPSAILRAPDEAARKTEFKRFVLDLRAAGKVLAEPE